MSESETDKKTYTLAEVAEHSSLTSLWLVIHNKVYDITEFVDEHPGGEEVLLEQAGKLSTEAFEDVGHSVDARELMKDYYIGDLCDEDKEPEYSSVLSGPAGGTDTKSTLAWVIPVAISVGIVAIAMYKMMSS